MITLRQHFTEKLRQKPTCVKAGSEKEKVGSIVKLTTAVA